MISQKGRKKGTGSADGWLLWLGTAFDSLPQSQRCSAAQGNHLGLQKASSGEEKDLGLQGHSSLLTLDLYQEKGKPSAAGDPHRLLQDSHNPLQVSPAPGMGDLQLLEKDHLALQQALAGCFDCPDLASGLCCQKTSLQTSPDLCYIHLYQEGDINCGATALQLPLCSLVSP